MESKSVSKIYTLNKTTYINLRWIAILGQFLTVNVVKYVFNFEFDILIVNVVIALGVISNLILIYFYEKNILSNRASFSFLLIDILQLSLILYFSGGVINPFSIFLIIPNSLTIECGLENMPDPLYARKSIWLPFMENELKIGAEDIIIGHSSGAVGSFNF